VGSDASAGEPGPLTLHVVSLGCPKNRVDSEVMLGDLVSSGGAQVVADPAAADVILVNTCAFLQAAIEESVDTILELAEHKRGGRCRKLLVAGCLVQSHGTELQNELPEVDAFLGLGELRSVVEAARGEQLGLLAAGDVHLYDHNSPRLISLRGPAAYIKIAEGCNRACSFCRIPAIRGRQQSRAPTSVLAEARNLLAGGVRELNLIAQDLTAYGREPGGPDSTLQQLLEQLIELPGLSWLRLLYLYPNGLTPALCELLTTRGSPLLPYVDLPLQHISDGVLRAMRRGHGGDDVRRLMDLLRGGGADVTLRTTFIVGFPGETEADYAELADFVRQVQPDRTTVFPYSAEPNTPAAKLPGRIPDEVVAARVEKLTALSQAIAAKRNDARVGNEDEVLVLGASEQSDLLWEGRIRSQGPEDIDGVTYLPAGSLPPDRISRVRITEAHGADLVAEPADQG